MCLVNIFVILCFTYLSRRVLSEGQLSSALFRELLIGLDGTGLDGTGRDFTMFVLLIFSANSNVTV